MWFQYQYNTEVKIIHSNYNYINHLSMKNNKSLKSIVVCFLLFVSNNIFSQNDEILCLPCIQQYIADANIIDVERSAICDDTYLFVLPNGTREVRYRDNICNPPIWILNVVCDPFYSIGTQCSSNGGSCEVEVELVQGVECVLPKVLSSGITLHVCNYLNGALEMNGPVGTKYKIAYQNTTNSCFSFCQQGQNVDVTCTEKITSSNEPEILTDCTSFEEYNVGDIVPQAGNKFTLFSNLSSQNAKVTSIKSSSGGKSLLISNSSDIDYNISQSLKENQVGRLVFKMFIPSGKTGAWGLETNDPESYVWYMQCSANSFSVLSKYQNVSGSSLEPIFNKWVNVALIFQPFKNTIEIWFNNNLVGRAENYQSNLVTDLNFYFLNGSNNNEMYIDELCYREWKKDGPCTQEYAPVCIADETYGNNCIAYQAGYSDLEIRQGACGVPDCVTLNYPAHNSSGIPTDVTITWPTSIHATSYTLNIGTSINGGDILYQNVGNVTSYNLKNLPANKEIFVSVLPSNDRGMQLSCHISKFTTKSNLQSPSCTTLTSPANNGTNVPRNINITWPSVAEASGYRLYVGKSSSTSEFLNADIGLITSYLLSNLPEDQNICVRVIPYNAAGSAMNCQATCFRTEKIIQIPSCTQLSSPINNQVNVPTTINLTWPPSPNATGYKIQIRDANNQLVKSDITLGNVSNYVVQNLPLNKFICVTITPFNAAGESQACTATCFETIKTSAAEDGNTISGNYILSPNPAVDYVYISCSSCVSDKAQIIIF
jgi:hypothetical protein